ncbi:PREDICTED: uncharacterized protein LOC105556876 [Vollenhovia emeryi]|uniref:uncharacterized protein LOC105556876 n=1 Tax=Vollenhovia emeryi TaxID=411798 RepID=UPI0005F380F0|nr:PREDICTED: uncharacterized protein LOC105556876 [Vollenhovia emeryi]
MKRIDCFTVAQHRKSFRFVNAHEALLVFGTISCAVCALSTLKMDAMQTINKRFPVIVISSVMVLKNESDSSESSDSENDDEIENISLNDMQTLFSILMADKSRGEQIAVEKITDYIDRVIPNYTNVIFKEHFRLYPSTFEMLLSLIGPALNATNTTTGRKPISAEKQLYIALWFMATPDSYRLCKLNYFL